MDAANHFLGIFAKIKQFRCSPRQQRQNGHHAPWAPITSLRMNGPPAPRPLRLALLDDHEVVRRGTALHLSRDARFRIVASHARSDELIDSLQISFRDGANADGMGGGVGGGMGGGVGGGVGESVLLSPEEAAAVPSLVIPTTGFDAADVDPASFKFT